jgi:hypothetical protein
VHQNISRNAIASFVLLLVLPGTILYAVVWDAFLDVWVAIAIVISPIAAVLLAHLSLKQMRASTGRTSGMRLAEMCRLFGFAEIGLISIVLLFSHKEDRKQAYAASAVGSLSALDEAARAYANSHPKEGFPASLAALSSAAQGDDYHSSLVRSLSKGDRSCYRFTYSARSTHSDEYIDAYRVVADPVCPGTTYLRHFFVDQTGTIRSAKNVQATAESPPLD